MSAHYLPAVASRPPDVGRHRLAPTEVAVEQIMCRDLVCARPDLEIPALIALMVDNRIGCIPVVDRHRRPVGIITKFDIVEQLHTVSITKPNGSPWPVDLAARTADEVMMPLALTLDESSTIADAALMMVCEDLHHVLVVSPAGTLVGVVSAKDVVTWLVRDHQGITSEP